MKSMMIMAVLTIAGVTFANVGDSWTLPAAPQGGNFTVYPGEGGDGTPAYESNGPARVYWTTVGTSMPTTTELYQIWYYQPAVGSRSWQPIESQIGGASGEVYPIDPRNPWFGQNGTNHQYGGAYGGTPGQWNLIDAGPQLPFPHQMWLMGGTSGLYTEWASGWSGGNTVGAIRLVQMTPEPTTALLLLLSLPLLHRKHKTT